MPVKPFRVDFKYSVEDQASFYICANNKEEATAGAEEMLRLGSAGVSYVDPEITSVEEYKKEAADNIPTLN